MSGHSLVRPEASVIQTNAVVFLQELQEEMISSGVSLK